MATPTAPAIKTDCYRILIVDDDADVRKAIRRILGRLELPCEVAVLEAHDETSAQAEVRSTYVDLILLDLFLSPDVPTGFELLTSLARQGCCAQVVMMTHYHTSRHFDRIMKDFASLDQPRVIKFFKTEDLGILLPPILGDCVADFANSGVTTRGLDFAAGLIERRRDRYPRGPTARNILRSTQTEVKVEVDRICRKLFGSTNGHQRSTEIRVELQQFDRRGLSAAVLLKAVVATTIDGSTSGPTDFECVVKLGPATDIQTEVARYHEYVRYGVQLKQRVELLDSASDQGIGAIAYSFAGGVYGHELASLDELLRTEPELAAAVIDDLFRVVSWYSVRAPDAAIRAHIDQSFRAKVGKAVELNTDNLARLANSTRFVRLKLGKEGADSTLEIDGAPALSLPGTNYLGEGWHLREFPRCLIHGDMHGGNVMVEIGNGEPSEPGLSTSADARKSIARVCLIDYRSAGPGPRCLDAVALESSVRIAHSEELGGDATTAGDLDGEDLHRAMIAAARQYETERQLYNRLLGNRRSLPPKAPWCRLAGNVITGLQTSFEDEPIGMEEYIQTALLYAVRQLAYEMPPIVRVRLCAWLSALYSIGKRVF